MLNKFLTERIEQQLRKSSEFSEVASTAAKTVRSVYRSGGTLADVERVFRENATVSWNSAEETLAWVNAADYVAGLREDFDK